MRIWRLRMCIWSKWLKNCERKGRKKWIWKILSERRYLWRWKESSRTKWLCLSRSLNLRFINFDFCFNTKNCSELKKFKIWKLLMIKFWINFSKSLCNFHKLTLIKSQNRSTFQLLLQIHSSFRSKNIYNESLILSKCLNLENLQLSNLNFS